MHFKGEKVNKKELINGREENETFILLCLFPKKEIEKPVALHFLFLYFKLFDGQEEVIKLYLGLSPLLLVP